MAKDLSKLKDIPPVDDAPTEQPDELTLKEEFDLTSGKQAKHAWRLLRKQYREQIKDIKDEKAELKAKLDDLDDVRVENAQLGVADRFSRIIFLVCTPAIIIGTILVGHPDEWGKAGWGLVVVACVVQLLVGLFNPRLSPA